MRDYNNFHGGEYYYNYQGGEEPNNLQGGEEPFNRNLNDSFGIPPRLTTCLNNNYIGNSNFNSGFNVGFFYDQLQ